MYSIGCLVSGLMLWRRRACFSYKPIIWPGLKADGYPKQACYSVTNILPPFLSGYSSSPSALWYSRCESGGVVALNAKQIQFPLIPKVSERTVYSWTESVLSISSDNVVCLRECWPKTVLFIRRLSRTCNLFHSLSSFVS